MSVSPGFLEGHWRTGFQVTVAEPQQENLRHLRHAFLQQFQAALLEGLQDHPAIAVGHVDMPGGGALAGLQPAAAFQQLAQVVFDAGELRRYLGLQVQARLVGAALGDVEHLVEGEDAQADEAGPGALGEGAIEPGAGVQALEFGESEAAHRVLGASREDLGDVGGALQGVVVEGDQYAVAAALHVGFQVVGAEVAGQ